MRQCVGPEKWLQFPLARVKAVPTCNSGALLAGAFFHLTPLRRPPARTLLYKPRPAIYLGVTVMAWRGRMTLSRLICVVHLDCGQRRGRGHLLVECIASSITYTRAIVIRRPCVHHRSTSYLSGRAVLCRVWFQWLPALKNSGICAVFSRQHKKFHCQM